MVDLLYLVLPSLLAIGLMVLLIRATGLSQPIALNDDILVKNTITAHFEGAQISRIVRSEDGYGALAYLKNAPALVLVRTLGDRLIVRPLSAPALKSSSGDGKALTIVLNDFTWPKMRLVFADAATREAEERAIEAAIKECVHA